MPFPPGGPTDVAARVLAEKLKDRVGQNVIVESKAGAGGATGTGYVAQQPGNGCTLLLAYDTHAVNPVLLQLPFDTLTAFKPVVMIGTIPNIIGAHPAQPYKTFAEMVAEAKREPDRLAYATGGTGTVAHLSMKQIEQQYGMQLRNVPYRWRAAAASGLIDQSQKMTAAAMQIADMKVWAHRSYRVWMRRQSLRLPNMFSILCRCSIEDGVMLDRLSRLDFDGMQGVMPRSASAWRNQSASYPLSASNCFAGGNASTINAAPL